MKIRFFWLLCLIVSTNCALAQTRKKLTLEEIWASSSFRPKMISGIKSMKDGKHYTTLSQRGNSTIIEKYAYADSKLKGVIFNSNDYYLPPGSALKFDEYTFSDDENKLLVPTDFERIYRYSGKSAYVVIDLPGKKAEFLSAGKQLLAEFSPDGKKVAFVRDNNLFIKNLETKEETGITFDGKINQIINGAPDWVYEEEFGIVKAFFWCPDSKKIAWLRFDESAVPEYGMPVYGSLYPQEYRFKYPKAGEKNSTVSVWIYDMENKKSVKVNTGEDMNSYIPRLLWNFDGSALSFIRLNRHQNHLELFLANPTSGDIHLLLEEKNNTYIDVTDNLLFLKDGKHFIWSSEIGGHNRLFLYSMAGKKIRALTDDKSDVTFFYGIDERNQVLYYQSASPTPMDRSIYSVSLSGKNLKRLVPYSGHCKAEFSNNYNYFILSQSEANKPLVYEMYERNGKKLSVLEDNAELIKKISSYAFSAEEFFEIPTPSGVKLNAWMIKPPDFNPQKKYPVFMTVYGGPGNNTVENAWRGSTFIWYQYLAQQGYIVVSVDNRGTGNRGEEFKKCTYKQLGKLETEDQIAAALYLSKQAYVDPTRIGIQGWSYGGYMSSLCITKGADVFKMAIAVAPVTNWRYYDSIYTERFMQTPEENASGYDDNSPINFVDRLKGKYLLIHGTADDNVHFQNTVEMTNALVEANKQFDLFFYPNKNHGIYGGNTHLHLFTMMTNYILKNL